MVGASAVWAALVCARLRRLYRVARADGAGRSAALGVAASRWLLQTSPWEAAATIAALGAAAMNIVNPSINARYLTSLTPFLYVALTFSIARLQGAARRVGWAALVLLVGFNLLNSQGDYLPSFDGPVLGRYSRFPWLRERSQEFLVPHRNNVEALRLLDESRPSEPIVAEPPFGHYLALPELGCVRSPIPAYCYSMESDFLRDYRSPPEGRISQSTGDKAMVFIGRWTEPLIIGRREKVLYRDRLHPPLVVYRGTRGRPAIGPANSAIAFEAGALTSRGEPAAAVALLLDALAREPKVRTLEPFLIKLCKENADDAELTRMLSAREIQQPREPGVSLALGAVADANGRFSEALGLSLAGLCSDSTPDATVASLLPTGTRLLEKKRFAEAEAAARRILQSAPDFSAAHWLLAAALAETKRPALAAVEFEAAARWADDDRSALDSTLRAGDQWQAAGRLDQSINAFRACLLQAPNLPEAQMGLGGALVREKRLTEARDCFLAVLERQPKHLGALYSLGAVRMDLGSYLQAIEPLQQALSIEPKFSDARYLLAAALVKQGKRSEAIAQLKKAVEWTPENFACLHFLAWLLATSPEASDRQGEEAVRLATKAFNIADETMKPACLDTLAAAQAESGRFAEAVASMDEAVRLVQSRGDAALAEKYAGRRSLYSARRPLREP